jgi:hypothetical protein
LVALLVDVDIQSQNECTFWIRRSSGRLCVDLRPANSEYHWNTVGVRIPLLPRTKPSEALNQEAMAIDSLTLKQFHEICYWDLSRHRNLCCSTSATVNLNAMIMCPSRDHLENSVEIALLLDAEFDRSHWVTGNRVTGEVMEGGWTR